MSEEGGFDDVAESFLAAANCSRTRAIPLRAPPPWTKGLGTGDIFQTSISLPMCNRLKPKMLDCPVNAYADCFPSSEVAGRTTCCRSVVLTAPFDSPVKVARRLSAHRDGWADACLVQKLLFSGTTPDLTRALITPRFSLIPGVHKRDERIRESYLSR